MTWRYLGMTICFVCLLSVNAKGGDDIVYEDLTLSLSVPKAVHLGSDIMFNITLKSTTKQSVYSVETADLVVTVQDIVNPEKKYVCDWGRIRSESRMLDDGSSFSKTSNVKKQLVHIGDGESSAIDISMLQDVGTRLSCGNYSVSVVYEGEIRANTTFCIVVDYERSIPDLIDLVASADEWTRSWARDNLFAIVGQPVWKPSRADSKERIDSEVAALKKWWEDNKELILLVESVVLGNK